MDTLYMGVNILIYRKKSLSLVLKNMLIKLAKHCNADAFKSFKRYQIVSKAHKLVTRFILNLY